MGSVAAFLIETFRNQGFGQRGRCSRPTVARLVAQPLEPMCDSWPLADTMLGALHEVSLQPRSLVLLALLMVSLI